MTVERGVAVGLILFARRWFPLTVDHALWSNHRLPKRTNPHLLLPVHRGGGLPLTRQIEARLRELAPGTLLPPTRQLAADLAVSRGTVVRAYAQLRHEGRLEGRVGAGSRISAAPGGVAAPRSSPPEHAWHLDLHPEVTDLAAFPRRAWLRAYASAVQELPDRALGYEEPRGLSELREELAVYLDRARGVRCEADQVVVCAGMLSGLAIVRSALAAHGVRCLHRARVSHRALREPGSDTTGVDTAWLDVDDDGLVVDGLPRRAGQAVLVEPAGSYPLGAPLAPGRVEELSAWARRHGAILVESDVNAELDHHGVGAPALQGSLPEQTVLIGSTSRALAPGLRVGWIVAPPGLVGAITEARRTAESAQPGLEQLALARFLAAGDLDRHLRRLRSTYRSRARRLAGLLHQAVPGVRLDVPRCGFHLVMGLPDGTAGEAQVVAAAARRRVRLVGLDGHVLHGPKLPPALVLGYGALPEAAMGRAVGALGDAMGEGKV